MNAMLVKYLKDFGAPEPVTPVAEDILASLASPEFEDSFSLPELEPAIDLEAERLDAHQQGYAEAAEEYEQRYAGMIAEMQEAHRKELAEITARHENDVMATIHARFHDMTLAVSQLVAEQTMGLLLPMIEENIARRAIDALAQAVEQALVESKGAEITVRGPAHLYELLSKKFGEEGLTCRHVETATTDIVVNVDDTVMSTRLGVWAQSLAGVLA